MGRRSVKRVVPVVPYGHRIACGSLVPEPREQAVVAIVRDERARGTSFVRIARMLTERGFTTRTGKPFGSTAVYGIAKGLEEQAGVVMVCGR